MGDFVNTVVIGLTAFIVLVSGFWYVAEVGAENQVSFATASLAWGAVEDDHAELQVRLAYHNPHRVQVEWTRVEFEILANDQRLHWTQQTMRVAMPPGAQAVHEIPVELSGPAVERWLAAHVRNGEMTTLALHGWGQFLVGQTPENVPFTWKGTPWTTRLAPALEDAIPRCEADAGAPCVRTADAAWALGRSTPGLAVALAFENPDAHPVRLLNMTVDVRLHDATVAKATMPDPVPMSARGRAEAQLAVRFDDAGVRAWWPRHVASDEESPISVHVSYTLEEVRVTTVPAGNATGNATDNDTQENRTVQQTSVRDVAWIGDAGTFQTRFLSDRNP